MCAIIYPVVVHMTWGGGFIAGITIGDAVYSDFAGSGVVHLTGGVAAFVGASSSALARASTARTASLGRSPATRSRSPSSVCSSCGSAGSASTPGRNSPPTTSSPASPSTRCSPPQPAASPTTAVIWLKTGKPDVAFIGNGVLAGLVAITGPCGAVTPVMSIIIGAIGGVIVVFSVLMFDKLKVDDPVGAISVHGVVGVWGLLAIGLFASKDDAFLGRADAGLFYGGGFEQLAVQFLMALIIIVWVGIASLIVFGAIKATIGLRVSDEEEVEGLDVPEHGLQGYAPDTVSAH